MAERKPRFVVDETNALIFDTESLALPGAREVVAAAVNDSWARIIVDALNRTTQ